MVGRFELGESEGEVEGFWVSGAMVGADTVGGDVGTYEGETDGSDVRGETEGLHVGTSEGQTEGLETVGSEVGAPDGETEGLDVASSIEKLNKFTYSRSTLIGPYQY